MSCLLAAGQYTVSIVHCGSCHILVHYARELGIAISAGRIGYRMCEKRDFLFTRTPTSSPCSDKRQAKDLTYFKGPFLPRMEKKRFAFLHLSAEDVSTDKEKGL